MTNYILFAARDGETLVQRSVHSADSEAREWAAARIIARFGLGGPLASWDDIVAECDGVALRYEDQLD